MEKSGTKSETKNLKRKKRSSTGSNTSPNEKKLKELSSEDESLEEGTIAIKMSVTASNGFDDVDVGSKFNKIFGNVWTNCTLLKAM